MIEPSGVIPVSNSSGELPNHIARYNDKIYVVDHHTFAAAAWRNSMLEGRLQKGATLALVDYHTDFATPERALFPSLEDLAKTRDVQQFVRELKHTSPVDGFADKFIIPEMFYGVLDPEMLAVTPQNPSKPITRFTSSYSVGPSTFLYSSDAPQSGEHKKGAVKFASVQELNKLLKGKSPSEIILSPDSDYFSYMLGLYDDTAGTIRREGDGNPHPRKETKEDIDQLNQEFVDALEFEPGAIILATSPRHIPRGFDHNHWVKSLVEKFEKKYK